MRPLLLAALLAGTPALAQGDPRLQVVPFVPDTVTTLRVIPGYVSTVVLGPDERVVSVAVGNSAAWEVTPNKTGDHLFVKSLAAGTPTNVEVVTDLRHYSFLLQSTVDGDPQAAFRLAFTYETAAPAPTPASVTDAPHSPAVYRIAGAHLARPLTVWDDGTRTRFQFADTAALPAIYAIDEQRHEVLVTAREESGVLVVDRIWPRYVLRLGNATARVERRLPKGVR